MAAIQQDPTLSAVAQTPAQIAAAANGATTGAGSLDPTISSSSLTPATPITPVQPAPTTPAPSVETTATTLGTNEKEASSLSKEIQALNDSLSGESTYQTQQNTAAGVDAIQSSINDNNVAIKQLQNQAKAIPQIEQQNVAGRGVTAAGLAPIQTGDLRNNSIQALTLSSISDALSNNLVAAQTKANQAVQAVYGPQEAQLKAKMANLDLILKDPATTLEEKTRANAQLAIQNKAAADLAQQKTDAATVLKTAQDAATNAANFKPIAVDGAYYPTLSSALNAIANAKTPAEALKIQTQTGLVASQNKTQIIGSAETGYTSVTTDQNGKVISTTPVLAGTGGKTNTYTFTPTVKTSLLGAGETASTVTSLQNDIAKYGAQYVLDNGVGLTDATKQIIESEFNVTPTANKNKGLFGLGFLGL